MRPNDLCSLLVLILIAVSSFGTESAVAQIKSVDETITSAEEKTGPTFSWNLSLNPSWGRSLDVNDDPITNQNAAKLTFELKQNILGSSYVSAVTGVQADPKFASTLVVPGAGVFGQFKLGSRIPVGTPDLDEGIRDAFNISSSYKITRGYRDDDDASTEDDFTDHQFGAELAFTNVRFYRARSAAPDAPKDPSAYWKATAGYARILSNNDIREKSALTGTFDWNYAFNERYPDINLQGAIERSRFDELVAGAKRRETLYSLFGGIDVKKSAPFEGVKKAVIGLKLSRLNSSLVDADDTRVVVQIGLDFGG